MKSKTSFFNRTIFIKTICRFWPLWVCYFLAWVLIGIVPFATQLDNWQYYQLTAAEYAARVHNELINYTTIAGVVSMFAALATAVLVWSFMFNARSTSGYASLPVNRRAMFVSLTSAGLVMMVLVNLVVSLIMLAVSAAYGAADAAAAMQLFGLLSLTFVFFYGFAVFCAQLTGNAVAMAFAYIVLQFTALCVYYCCVCMGAELIYGFVLGNVPSAVEWLTPLFNMTDNISYTVVSHTVDYSTAASAINTDAAYSTYGVYSLYGFRVAVIYAVVGLAFFAAAALLYKRRSMECATDIVSMKILRPILKYCMTFGCALILALFATELFYSYSSDVTASMLAGIIIFALVGAFVGFFGSAMLMAKSFRVFKGAWRGYGASAVIIIALVCAFGFDFFGIESRIPDADKVETVTVSYSGYYFTFDDPDIINSATALHAAALEDKELANHFWEIYADASDDWWYCNFDISYKLKSGGTINRSYNVPYLTSDESTQANARLLQEIMNSPEAIAQRAEFDFAFTERTINYGSVYVSVTADELEGVKKYMYDENNNYIEPYVTFDVDNSSMFYRVDLYFTTEELAELFNTCIVPDIADNTLGRLWIIEDDEYEATVCSASISINAYDEVSPGSYGYDSCYVNVTLDAERTVAWLTEHGVPLHTVGEVYGSSSYTYGWD
ncbi:MAG: hypothetical protein LUE06_09685 [Oscillospiraceae bacterium]|nr:hypothetical protein [Oscillospiraceae bacterium]